MKNARECRDYALAKLRDLSKEMWRVWSGINMYADYDAVERLQRLAEELNQIIEKVMEIEG